LEVAAPQENKVLNYWNNFLINFFHRNLQTMTHFSPFSMVYYFLLISLKKIILGHHGPECAAYASAHFVECLFESMDGSAESTGMEKVLKDSFEKMDKRITALCQNAVNKL
jgi:hypothetical protein